jgi:hypothetical protein
MYTNINFLKERTRLQEMELIRDKRIAFVTSIFLGVFLAVVASLLFYQLFLRSQLNKLVAASTTEQQTLRSLLPVQNSFLLMQKKAKTIAAVFSKRGNKWDAITYFYNLLPEGNVINSVDLKSGTTDSLEFSVQSATVFSYAKLSDVLQSSAALNGSYSFDLGILTRGRDGVYRTNITVLFDKKDTKPAPKPRT